MPVRGQPRAWRAPISDLRRFSAISVLLQGTGADRLRARLLQRQLIGRVVSDRWAPSPCRPLPQPGPVQLHICAGLEDSLARAGLDVVRRREIHSPVEPGPASRYAVCASHADQARRRSSARLARQAPASVSLSTALQSRYFDRGESSAVAAVVARDVRLERRACRPCRPPPSPAGPGRAQVERADRMAWGFDSPHRPLIMIQPAGPRSGWCGATFSGALMILAGLDPDLERPASAGGTDLHSSRLLTQRAP